MMGRSANLNAPGDALNISMVPERAAGSSQRDTGTGSGSGSGSGSGLEASLTRPENLERAYRTRSAEFVEHFAPRSAYERWLVQSLARYAVQLDRYAELGIADLRRQVDRARDCWDYDRKGEVITLGGRLSRDPERIVARLRKTAQGARWLMERWFGLGNAVQANGCWNDEQRSMAFDLLGVPRLLRNGHYLVPMATDASGIETLVREQVALLREARETFLDSIDAREREMTIWGMPVVEDAETRRLRRNESAMRHGWNRMLTELIRVQAQRDAGDGHSTLDARASSGRSSTNAVFQDPILDPSEPPEDDPGRHAAWKAMQAGARFNQFLQRVEQIEAAQAEEARTRTLPTANGPGSNGAAAPLPNRKQRRAQQRQAEQSARRRRRRS